jgi:hypothetical protein
MLFKECISVAISAWVFFEVLTAPGMIFEFWYKWLERLSKKAEWLAKPLGYCGTCFSGQLGFWWYLISRRDVWRLGEHIVFTLQVIAFFLVIKKTCEVVEIWLKKLKKESV